MTQCYHNAMADKLARYVGYLHPEEYRWLQAFAGKSLPDCTDAPCTHWPIFTVCDGSPYAPYYGVPETYKGFRSDPKPLLGLLRLFAPGDDARHREHQAYLRQRLGGAA